jgi:sulfur relay (sulfurtransferase) DsrF/TusC family protein
MPRSVVSLVRRAGAGLRGGDPVLEATAYAVAEDVDLQVLLVGDAVELAAARAAVADTAIAGVRLPPAAGAQDLRGIVESGVRVLVRADDLAQRGIAHGELLPGVGVLDAAAVADLLHDAEAVLAW